MCLSGAWVTGRKGAEVQRDLRPDVRALRARPHAPLPSHYTSGPLSKQYGQVLRKINRLALP